MEVSFDLDVLDSYPTFVGFVWTDAVASAEALRAPIALVTVTDANGEETVRRINEIPLASELSDAQADDTLISFLDEDGIRDMAITVVTDGTGLGGGLAIDHIQYGFAALSGDTDVDGDVDFSDFVNLSSHFGMTDVGWAEGDFDHNGEIDFPDFLRLSRNFGETSDPVISNAPEPSSSVLLILSSMSLLVLRKRF